MSKKKTVRATKVISAVHTDYHISAGSTMRELERRIIDLTSSYRISISFSTTGDSCYTTVTKSGKSRLIVLGGGIISQIAHLPELFDNKDEIKSKIPKIATGELGVFLHELGHNLKTDMTSRLIIDYPKPEYRALLHQLNNILEDPKEEYEIDKEFTEKYPYLPKPGKFFNYMIDQLFMPQAEEYVDHGSANDLLNYILLVLRVGKTNIKNECKVYTKYETDLVSHIKGFMLENNPTERIKKAIAMGEWMIENIKEIDWESATPPETPISGSLPEGMGAPSAGSMTEKEADEMIDHGSSKAKSSEEKSDDGKGTSESEEKAEDDEKESKDEEPECPISDSSEDEEITEDVYNDIVHDGDDHEWVIAKDEYEYNETVIERLDDQIQQFTDTINDVSKFLKLFKGRIKPRAMSGFTRGKFDVRRAITNKMKGGCDTKLFKQEVKRGQDADLAVSLLCDNSGSMSGLKSALCSRAALTLAQACEWADIPFECNCFTKTADCVDGTCITITEKSFDDSFDQSKPYFAINDSQLLHAYLQSEKAIPTFRGNSEEINLYYIWKKFAKVKHKSKLLIVMCDGATTGSENDLKEIVRKIEAEDGIIVLGIGIMCSEVADIYPHHKLFNSEKELADDLATYLVDVIGKYAI